MASKKKKHKNNIRIFPKIPHTLKYIKYMKKALKKLNVDSLNDYRDKA